MTHAGAQAPCDLDEAVDADAPVDIAALFEAHAGFIARVVTRLAGPGDHVDDVVQEVFLTAYRSRNRLSDHSDLRGWLYRVAVNMVRHHRRSFARRRALSERAGRAELAPNPSTPQEDAMRQQTIKAVQACVDKLPLKQREVFVLFEMEEMEGADIATLLSLPVNTVWSRLRVARDRFKKLWTAAQGRDGYAPTS